MREQLKRAIVLRMAVREALDRDADLREVCRLNRLADAAYAVFPHGHSVYQEWAFGRISDEEVMRLIGSDATG